MNGKEARSLAGVFTDFRLTPFFFFLIGSSVDPQLHENSVEADFSPLPQTKPIRGVNLGVVLDLGMRRVFTGCVLGGTTWLFLQMDQFL